MEEENNLHEEEKEEDEEEEDVEEWRRRRTSGGHKFKQQHRILLGVERFALKEPTELIDDLRESHAAHAYQDARLALHLAL